MKFSTILALTLALCAVSSVSAWGSCNRQIAQEYPPPGEAAAIDTIKKVIGLQQADDSAKGHANRFFHAKGHGCVDATFTIRDDLPTRFQKGIFQPGKKWDTIVRLSNGQTEINPDKTPDTRGFAFKVLNVPGPKLQSDDPTSQDFITAAYETFFVPDATAVSDIVAAFSTTGFIGAVQKGKILLKYPRSVKAITLTAIAGSRISNVLGATFWSQTPYLLGEGQAVKYRIQPCRNDAIPGSKDGDNYLRETMLKQLYTFNQDACFNFYVQPQEDACRDDIEDSMKEWGGDWTLVGTIDIAAGQDFDTQGKQQQCENLQITPWHSLAEHRPLGINRIRKDIYIYSSDNRHSLNGQQVYKPSSTFTAEAANAAKIAEPTPTQGSAPVAIIASIAGIAAVAAAIAFGVITYRRRQAANGEKGEVLLDQE